MIALASDLKPVSRRSAARQRKLAAQFLELLPLIRRIALHAFRKSCHSQRDEQVQEVVCNAYCAFARLAERGKEAIAYATPLARFAIAQYRAGRRVGSSLNVNDLTSSCCQRRHSVSIDGLFKRTDDGDWKEILVEDGRSGPAELAAMRLDFRQWLTRLGRQKRAVAILLAKGTATVEAANKLGVSAARVSQLRRDLRDDWQVFQGPLAAI